MLYASRVREGGGKIRSPPKSPKYFGSLDNITGPRDPEESLEPEEPCIRRIVNSPRIRRAEGKSPIPIKKEAVDSPVHRTSIMREARSKLKRAGEYTISGFSSRGASRPCSPKNLVSSAPASPTGHLSFSSQNFSRWGSMDIPTEVSTSPLGSPASYNSGGKNKPKIFRFGSIPSNGIQDYIGNLLLRPGMFHTTLTNSVLSESDYIGFFFSTYWKSECRQFSSMLQSVCSNKIFTEEGRRLTLILVSEDIAEKDMRDHHKNSTFYSIPFKELKKFKFKTRNVFPVKTIPTLIITDLDCKVLTMEGVKMVKTYGELFMEHVADFDRNLSLDLNSGRFSRLQSLSRMSSVVATPIKKATSQFSIMSIHNESGEDEDMSQRSRNAEEEEEHENEEAVAEEPVVEGEEKSANAVEQPAETGERDDTVEEADEAKN
mmetsp:Transcript_18063/g.28778  ORF Transcript_18063/g.28778 Transcript_18063/m.28778 type:complete len:432 (+) Transcript_18063:115-1410(+)